MSSDRYKVDERIQAITNTPAVAILLEFSGAVDLNSNVDRPE